MSAFKKMNAYFISQKKLTLVLLWLFFALALGYALTALLLIPTLNYWLMLIPSVICLYFRIIYAKASYDPTKDRFSPQYIPTKERNALRKQQKHAKKKRKK